MGSLEKKAEKIERFRPVFFMNLRWNEEKLKSKMQWYVEVDFIEMTLGSNYDVRCDKNHLK